MYKLIAVLFLFSTQGMAQKLIISDSVKFLALGDSYTIGESVPANLRWPMQLTDSLNQHGIDCSQPKIVATTGWRTDDLKKAITKAKLKPKYNLVSLLIGVNNYFQGRSPEQYRSEFEELLRQAIKLAGGDHSRVFVLSIPDYGYTPFGKDNQEKISAGVDAFNAVNKSISEKLGVKYYFITDISRRGLMEPDLVASDGLHPSGKMYAEWVKLIVSDFTLEPRNEDED
jgi:lysophospholipase L1-like esterase